MDQVSPFDVQAKRRREQLWIAGTVALIIVVAVGAYFFRPRQQSFMVNQPPVDTTPENLPVNEYVVEQPLTKSADSDGDGMTAAKEKTLGTDPSKRDTDGDGLLDGEEVVLKLNPLVADTDGDGVSDGAEFRAGKNPLDKNSN